MDTVERYVPEWGDSLHDLMDGYREESRRLRDALEAAEAKQNRLRSALTDMLAGWHYIRQRYGDLDGVGWDRCEESASAALEMDPTA